MRFEVQEIELPLLYDQTPCFDIQPINGSNKSEWIVLKGSGELIHVDFDSRSMQSVARVEDGGFDRKKEAFLRVSDNGRFVALANQQGLKGVVIDLSTGRQTMSLEREDYYSEHCPFPIAFFQRAGKTLLVHSTLWNRVDISDPATGELMTSRVSPTYQDRKTRPEHYLDYFHGSLLPSPNGEWIADNGWVWHPMGIVRTWSVERWLNDNPWESEDGPTAKGLTYQDNWDDPICWIDQRTLGAWTSVETSDEHEKLVFGFFDVESGEQKKVLDIPKGRIFVEGTHLFVSKTPYKGVAIWEIESGKNLENDVRVNAVKYHQGAKQFWGFGNNLIHLLSKFIEKN